MLSVQQNQTEQNPQHKPESACPINAVLHLISAKWTTEIMRELSIGPVRTRRFLRLIPGLSMKCLQERLKALKAAGMIESIEEPQKVEHRITDRGKKLFSILVSLKQLASELMEVECVCPMESDCHSAVASSAEFYCPVRPQDGNRNRERRY